ncbi:hypothetical protein [Streptomyces sp. 2A115]|uniref:hypothetical protein n=1 Tax=Streptomyces sp. 2A115 TaxID=3457439 RepID=UPI003FCF5B98
MSEIRHYDAVVVHGGPGGSGTTSLSAERGRQVLVPERERFPRYRTGESMITGVIPMMILAVLEREDG